MRLLRQWETLEIIWSTTFKIRYPKYWDLTIGLELEGTVRNVVDFGAFVDVGLKEDGLVHISKISKSFVKHPSDVLNVGDIVKVYVLNVDKERGKVGLTMIKEWKKVDFYI